MVTITDSGVGIPEKDREDIFQPLIPRQSGYHFQAGSPGLSLALCKAIIERHGGQLGITWSKPGRGSAFYFTLPAINPDASESKGSTAKLT